MTFSQFSRKVSVLLLGACMALLTTGCFKLNMSIVVESDGSGAFSGDFAVSKQLGEVFGDEQEGFSCDEVEEDFDIGLLSDLPSNADVSTYEDDNWCGFRFTSTFTDFGKSLVELGDDDFPLSVDQQILTFSFPIDDDDAFGGDLGGDMEDIDPALLLEAFGIPEPEFTISVDLPGEIIEHNADSLNGSTLTWRIDFFSLDPNFSPYAKADLQATSSSGGGVGKIIGIVLGIVGLIALLTALKFNQLRRATVM
mgnify:CR=1 FL=1